MALKLRFEKPFVRDNTDRIIIAESEITQNAQEIASRVTLQTYNALEDRVNNAESTITQNADAIAQRVTQSTFNALAGRVSTAESSITQQAGQIASKVSTTDYTGIKIASLINQTASTVKIQASHIQLEGIVTANTNFKVLADGSIEAVNAKLSGSITATKMIAAGYTNYYGEIGLTGGYVGLGLFDLRYGPEAFFEVLESDSGLGFLLRDKNNRSRVEATPGLTRLTSPSGAIRLTITDTYVNIIKNGNVIGNWG